MDNSPPMTAPQTENPPEPTPAARIRELIAMTEKLSAIFVRENECLSDATPEAIVPMQAEKAQLAGAYAQTIKSIGLHRDSITETEIDLLAELRAATTRFNALAERQQALLSGLSDDRQQWLASAATSAGGSPENSGSAGQGNISQPQRPVAIDEEA